MSDAETLAVYAQKADEYAAMTDHLQIRDSSLKHFIAAMPKGGEVLDLGCGPGASAALMAQAGLNVTAYDPVAEMVALAQKHQGVTARVAGFDDLEAVDQYHGIWANFSLLHAPREDMPRHLRQIAQALKSGGRLHIALKTGTGSSRDSIGRLYTYYTDEELTGLLEDAGFTISHRKTGEDKGLSGEIAPWIGMTAHA